MSSASTAATAHPPTYSIGLTKLQTTGLPILRGHAPTALEITIWVREFSRWAQLSGYGQYIEGPIPSGTPDASSGLAQRDCLRYISAAVESPSLRGALADKEFTSSRKAWEWFKSKLLHGESESTVLKRQMQNAVFREDLGIQAFLSDFILWYTHISPTLPATEAAELLNAALPQSYDIYIQSAMRDPGLASKVSSGTIDQKESFISYTDELASLAARASARSTARALKHGNTTNTIDTLVTHPSSNPTLTAIHEQGFSNPIDSPVNTALLDTGGDTDLRLKIDRAVSEMEALATQLRSGGTRTPPSKTSRPGTNTSTGTPLANVQCFACAEYGHVSSNCPKEPKPQCNHGLCIWRQKRVHLPQFCPFQSPSSIKSPHLQARCIHEANLWRAAQEAALKNATPALPTSADEEAQHSLEDLLDNTCLEYEERITELEIKIEAILTKSAE